MSVLTTVFKDSEARLVRTEGTPGERGFKLVRRWEASHSNYIDTLAITRVFKKTYRNPRADFDTSAQGIKLPYRDYSDTGTDTRKYYKRGQYVGTFVHSKHTIGRTDEGNFDVVQELTKVKPVTAFKDLDSYEPIEDYTDEKAQPFSKQHTREKKKIFAYRFIDPTTDTYFRNVADTKLRVLAPSTSYRFSGKRIKEEDDGTHTYLVTWGFNVPSNTLTNVQPTGEIRKYVNPNVKSIDSVGKSKIKIFDRVDINDIDSIMVKGDSNDTKYVTQSINYDDNGDGSVTVNKVMDRYNTRDTFYFSDGTDGIGWHSDMITRIWPRIRDTKAAAIVLPGRKARVGFKQGSDSYRHQSFTRDRHGDGTSTVMQKGENPKTIYSIGTSGNRIDTLYDLRFGKREPTATNNPFSATAGEVQIRTARLETNDTNTALEFARGSTLDGRLEYREGRIRYLGDGRYEAFKVVYKPVGS